MGLDLRYHTHVLVHDAVVYARETVAITESFLSLQPSGADGDDADDARPDDEAAWRRWLARASDKAAAASRRARLERLLTRAARAHSVLASALSAVAAVATPPPPPAMASFLREWPLAPQAVDAAREILVAFEAGRACVQQRPIAHGRLWRRRRGGGWALVGSAKGLLCRDPPAAGGGGAGGVPYAVAFVRVRGELESDGDDSPPPAGGEGEVGGEKVAAWAPIRPLPAKLVRGRVSDDGGFSAGSEGDGVLGYEADGVGGAAVRVEFVTCPAVGDGVAMRPVCADVWEVLWALAACSAPPPGAGARGVATHAAGWDAGAPDAMAKLAAMMSAAGMPTVARGGVTP